MTQLHNSYTKHDIGDHATTSPTTSTESHQTNRSKESHTKSTASGQPLTLIKVENTNHVFVEMLLRMFPWLLESKSVSRREGKLCRRKTVTEDLTLVKIMKNGKASLSRVVTASIIIKTGQQSTELVSF